MSDLEAKIQMLHDIEEIRKLKYLYCRYNDGGWPDQPVSHQGPSADLFVEDAVWDGRPVAYAEGREEIRRFFASLAAMPMVYHAVMNPIIEVDGDTATGHWHIVGGGVGTTNEGTLGLGCYEDVYVRTAEGWRVKSMRMVWGPRTVLPASWQASFPSVR